MKLIKKIQRAIENKPYRRIINHYFEEVADDIRMLKEQDPYKNNLNPIVKYLYGEEEDLLKITKEIISDKYKEKYCPSTLFDYFNQSERMNYMMFRIEIDKILGIKNNIYKM